MEGRKNNQEGAESSANRMNDREFLVLRNYVKEKSGMDMTRKREIVETKIGQFIENSNYPSLEAYLMRLQKDPTGKMEQELMNLLTINHTFFMRETEHFDFLRATVLPYLKEKHSETKDLAVWCGASSTGEEPYTLAMILLDYFGLEHRKWDTTILATDISTKALTKAVNGVYDKEQVEALPAAWKRRFLRPAGPEQYRMSEEVRKEVIFRTFNLMEPLPFKRKFDVVFLRNVMIYFDETTKDELLTRIYNNMEPGGYLFIGRTETLDRKKVPFRMVQPSIFRKPENVN